MEIQPIHTEGDYERALARVDRLMDAKPDTPEGDELEILTTLVDAYELTHHPIAPPDPVEAIQFRMEQQGLTRADLEPYIGSRGRVSEILNRRRPLTLPMIRALHTELAIPLDSLIGRERAA